MHPRRISERKEKANEALEAGELTAEAQEALVDVLTPDAYEQTWPDVEVVLHVAEHPVVAKKMREERLPEPLETALVEAFSAVLPLLGTRAFGPLSNFVDRTRQRLDAERRKYEMVAERVASIEEEEAAVRLLRNYVSTSPAPLFVARMRQQHPKLVAEAERQSQSGVDLDVLVKDAALLTALGRPEDVDAAAVKQSLTELSAHPDISLVTLKRAFETGTAEQKLAAAAVATFDAKADFAPAILGEVLSGAHFAPQFAVMAGRLAPLMARQVFSQFLAEAAWQNPEEPEAQITAERTHAILSARCVLPKVGSPLDAVELDALPETLDDDRLREVPRTIDQAWALWSMLLSGHDNS